MEADEFKGLSHDDVVRFIDAYKASPELWNQSHPNYNNKPVRIEAWGRIAGKFGLTKVECKKNILGLISKYRKLKVTAKEAKANGDASEPSWFAYRALTFLDGREAKQEAPPQVHCPVSEREVIIDIMTLYKQNRCLWDNTHPLFVNKEARHEAFCTMLEELKKIHPMSNVDTMKRKIENWKNAYRRQRSKMNQSKKNGKEGQPTLWYYNYLTFLDEKNEFPQENEETDFDSNDMFQADTDFIVTRESNLSDQEETQVEQQNESQQPATQQEFGVVHETRKRRRKTNKHSDDTQLTASTLQLLESMKKRLRNENKRNEINAFCKFISSKISSYSSSTRQGVQHALYDILVEADRGRYEQAAGTTVRMTSSPNIPAQHMTFAQSLQNISKSHTYSSSKPALETVISKEEAVEYEYLQDSPSHESMSGSSEC